MATKRTLSLNIRTARDLAVQTLMAFEQEDRGIQPQLDEHFSRSDWSAADKALAAEIALGVCRRTLTLDAVIAAFSNRNLKRIDPLLRQILRVALYQLIYLDGIADYAAVSEAVNQARNAAFMPAPKSDAGFQPAIKSDTGFQPAIKSDTGFQPAQPLSGKKSSASAGFVNALLRGALHNTLGKQSLSQTTPLRRTLDIDGVRGMVFSRDILPDPAKQPAKYFSTAYGLPVWLIERWLKNWPQPTVHELCQAANRRPTLTLRLNCLRCRTNQLALQFQQAGIDFILDNHTIFIPRPIDPRRLPGYDEGLFSVQDYTAQQVAPRLEPQPGMRILDLCAAPGGKATHLAELMNNQGTIVACDVSADKLARIEENARRLGLTIIQTCIAADLPQLLEKHGSFDAVLADVPCSNTGVLARRVEVRHRLTPSGLKDLAKIQAQLLQTARSALRPGGKLLYSTCSIETVENNLQVKRFLEQHPQDKLLSEELTLPGLLPREDTAHDDLPHDGGYTALIRRA